MARPGPKRKPEHIKLVSGTTRKDRKSKRVVGSVEGDPVRPKWLKGMARKIWDQKVERYMERNQEVAGFEDSLAQYCALEAALIDHYKRKLTPKTAMINAHRVYANEFFDTPASQLQPGKPGKPQNPFLKNGRRPK